MKFSTMWELFLNQVQVWKHMIANILGFPKHKETSAVPDFAKALAVFIFNLCLAQQENYFDKTQEIY